MAVDLIYETHAITTDNEAGIASGWCPGQLSEAGRAAARQLGERRRSDGMAAVFTSDLQRAVDTAEIAFSASGISIHQDRRLRECNYGDLNGTSVAELATRRRQHIDVPFPGGESYLQVVGRTREFLADLQRDRPNQRVLVIAHSANRWALQVLLGGAELADLVDAPFGWQPGWHFTVPSR
ncbi:histidine phosphatase family protein [Phytoactinopolyspora limicola]|uniref:histidine phosphatase family protein n=1 Tax=Phytoactinopolyspora limicola TaxID=2715536 RepID=UPI00140DF875|nr:histidine phosphatase family protein [Phytoactinopolyspora limicola]